MNFTEVLLTGGNSLEGCWQTWQTQICSLFDYGLGEHAQERINAYIGHYYSFMGPMAQQIANSVPSTPEAIHDAIQAFAGNGVDELILWPCIAELDEVQRLTDIVTR